MFVSLPTDICIYIRAPTARAFCLYRPISQSTYYTRRTNVLPFPNNTKCHSTNYNNSIHTKFIHNTTLIVSYLLCTPKINKTYNSAVELGCHNDIGHWMGWLADSSGYPLWSVCIAGSCLCWMGAKQNTSPIPHRALCVYMYTVTYPLCGET